MRTLINTTTGDVSPRVGIINTCESGRSSRPRVMIASLVSPDQNGWLERLLNGLNKLSYPKQCLTYTFLVSDGSDSTFKMLTEFRKMQQDRVFIKDYDNDMGGMSRFMKLGMLRNVLFNAVEDEGYVLMVDSDVVSMPADLIQNLMTVPSGGVVAPLVMIENFMEFGNDFFYDDLAFIKDNVHFSHFYPYIPNYGALPTTPVEVDSVGTCYLCKSSIFREGARYVSDGNTCEQTVFCNHARQRGYKIFVNPSVRVLHK